MSNVITISNYGPQITNNGNVIYKDLKLSLQDYKPTVLNWTTWNGVLNKSDIVSIPLKYKFIFVRCRNLSGVPYEKQSYNPILSNFTCSTTVPNIINNCSCTNQSSDDSVLLNFTMNQYTRYKLDLQTLYIVQPNLNLDCSNGQSVSVVPGWEGTEKYDTFAQNEIPGILGGVCGVLDVTAGIDNPDSNLSGIYKFIAVGVLKDNNLIIKETNGTGYDYKLDYYVFYKESNNRIIYIWNETAGKWVFIHLDFNIEHIIQQRLPFYILEMVEYSETSYVYGNSNIVLPSEYNTSGGYVQYNNDIILADNPPQVFKINGLFVMESDSFDGTIVSQMDNLEVNILLAH